MSLYALAGCDCIASRRVRAWLLVAVMLVLHWAVPAIQQPYAGVSNPAPLETGLDYKAVDIVASDGTCGLAPRTPFAELPHGYGAIIFPTAPSLGLLAERAFDARGPPSAPFDGGLSTPPQMRSQQHDSNACEPLAIVTTA